MRALLNLLEAAATHRPKAVIVAITAATVGAAAAASQIHLEVDLPEFGRDDSEGVQAMEHARDRFADPVAAVQVILDTGHDGNVLTESGLAAVLAAHETTRVALGPALRIDDDGQPQMLSLAGMSASQPASQDGALLDVPSVEANPQLAAVLSDDYDPHAATARATMLVALLSPALDDQQRTDAARRLRDAFETSQDLTAADALADVEVTVLSQGLFVDSLADEMRTEMPLLFGLALLAVLAILTLMYRSGADVAIGAAGLLVTVMWTFGVIALLGPGVLGWRGPLSQLGVIVPVLLVGLGIDYAVHLTARYREQRAAGQHPQAAAGTALHSVGAALAIATAATATGFAASATAPLSIVADFGIFVAAGVVCAFLSMSLLVPAANVLRDRRPLRAIPTAPRDLTTAGLMHIPALVATRAPRLALATAAALTIGALTTVTALETELDRDDLIPAGSEIERLSALQRDLFGGGVAETTLVIIDGNLTSPAIFDALWQAQQRLAHIDGVRTVADQPQVRSIMTLAATALDHDAPPTHGGDPSEDTDPAAVYDQLRANVGRDQVDQLLTTDARSTVVHVRTIVGDTGADQTRQQIHAAFAPVEAAGAEVAVTSEALILAEMSHELGGFQARAIGLTLAVVLVLLASYYAAARRQPLLGVIALTPAIVSAAGILATMWALGISFNLVTASLTAVAVGIGVPYGVHVVNRFTESHTLRTDPREAIRHTLHRTGAALTGSALTTLGAFVVLSFSNLPPIQQMGLLGAAAIAFALLAALLVQPGALVLWTRSKADPPS